MDISYQKILMIEQIFPKLHKEVFCFIEYYQFTN